MSAAHNEVAGIAFDVINEIRFMTVRAFEHRLRGLIVRAFYNEG